MGRELRQLCWPTARRPASGALPARRTVEIFMGGAVFVWKSEPFSHFESRLPFGPLAVAGKCPANKC